MSKHSNIDHKVEEALESLQGIRRAETAPFMHTRVMARLQKEDSSAWSKAAYFIARPVVALATLCAVIAFNALIVLNKEKLKATRVPVAFTTASSSGEIAQDDDFLLASNTTYDYVNVEP